MIRSSSLYWEYLSEIELWRENSVYDSNILRVNLMIMKERWEKRFTAKESNILGIELQEMELWRKNSVSALAFSILRVNPLINPLMLGGGEILLLCWRPVSLVIETSHNHDVSGDATGNKL